MRSSRTTTVVVATAACAVLTSGVASAAWSIASTGTGAARATSLQPVTGQSATASGTTVSVTWTSPANPAGTLYRVVRTTGTPTTVCTVAAPPCTDTVSPGSYAYTVASVAGAKWTSATASASVTVVAGLTITSPAAGETGVARATSVIGSTGRPTGGQVTVSLAGPAGAATYSASVTPAADGSWTVTVPNNAKLDANTAYTATASQPGTANVTRSFTTGRN